MAQLAETTRRLAAADATATTLFPTDRELLRTVALFQDGTAAAATGWPPKDIARLDIAGRDAFRAILNDVYRNLRLPSCDLSRFPRSRREPRCCCCCCCCCCVLGARCLVLGALWREGFPHPPLPSSLPALVRAVRLGMLVKPPAVLWSYNFERT